MTVLVFQCAICQEESQRLDILRISSFRMGIVFEHGYKQHTSEPATICEKALSLQSVKRLCLGSYEGMLSAERIRASTR